MGWVAAEAPWGDAVGARVAALSARAVVVADTRTPSPTFGDAEYASIGAAFDTLGWPVDTRHFGTPTDVDRNGRVVVFSTRGERAHARRTGNFGAWAPRRYAPGTVSGLTVRP